MQIAVRRVDFYFLVFIASYESCEGFKSVVTF